MTENSLVPQPFNYRDRSELRAMFKQYLQAGKEGERLTWESITTREGLPHNWIYDLYQDSHERIWAGTWGGGVARFEEGKWQTFTTANGLHSNSVTCIREDTKGRIWLATDSGLNVMEDDRIADAGLRGKSLLNITFDQHGHLWAGCWRAAYSGGGLFRFNGHDWQSFTTRQELPGLEILKVFNDSRGQIWIGTYEQGLGAGVGCYDGHDWHNYTSRQGLVNDCVYSMFEDPGGNMWFGTVGGVSIFDGKTWHTLTDKDGLVDDRIYCMLIDSHKKMWFGTEAGVSRFDGQSWLSYTKKDGLVENLVRAIIEARDGSLWFGAYPYAVGAGGISVARYQDNKSLTDRLLDLLPEPPPPGLLPLVKNPDGQAKSMAKLIIDDSLIASLIKEVAPLVSSVTGWDLQIPTLHSRVLPKEQGYEEIVQGKLRLLGLPFSQERDIVDRTVEVLVENNVLAAYEPLSNELMVVRENVDDSNLDGLKLVLGHELTHRGQHVHHPALFERVNAILVNVMKGMESGQVDLQKTLGYYEEVKPLMTLIESHASYIQGVLKQMHFPLAHIETRFTLPVIIFRIIGVGKTSQYTEGLPQVVAAMQGGGVDRLFRSVGG